METFFLACFAFGALFTIASIVLGSIGGGDHGAAHVSHGGADAHPFFGHGHGHVAHAPSSHATAPHPEISGDGSGAPREQGSDVRSELPLLNASSFIGGLTWFGAAGYLLVRLGDWALPAVVVGALLAGAVGWYLIARFLGLVLAGQREMHPDDYRLEGTIANVTVGIPAGGTGEVVFSKAGARRSEAARAVGGNAIPRGSEVVITAFQDGFASVQPWGEFLAARERFAATEKTEA